MGRPRLKVLASSCTPKRRPRPRDLRPYAGLFKALGDETRLEIVSLLAESSEPLCACDIEAHFDLAQATVSHHLKVLRKAGWLTSQRRGTWIFYALDSHARDRLSTFASALP